MHQDWSRNWGLKKVIFFPEWRKFLSQQWRKVGISSEFSGVSVGCRLGSGVLVEGGSSSLRSYILCMLCCLLFANFQI
jgi:hypothetical protein